MNKNDFKVYSNPDIRKMMMQEEEEITIELEIPDEESIVALFLSSPYFVEMMRNQNLFYYPTDLSADESLLAPLFSKEVFDDFVKESKMIRMKEEIPLGPLLHVPVEDEEGETKMFSIFDGLIQMEFMKFFQTAVMIGNPDACFMEEFEDAFMQLVEELEDNGYLDEVIQGISGWLDSPEVLSDLLFREDEEE